MIITCPRCSTRYVIDPAVLVPNGRAVGCTNCGHHWTQLPSDPEPSQPPITDPAPEPVSAAPPADAFEAPEPTPSEAPEEDLQVSSPPEPEEHDEPKAETEPEPDKGEKAELSLREDEGDAADTSAPASLDTHLQPNQADEFAADAEERPDVAVPSDEKSEFGPDEGRELGSDTVTQLGSDTVKDSEALADADRPESATAEPEPEPIPASLRKGRSPAEQAKQNQKKKPSVAMLAGIGALVALVVIAVVLILARGPLVSAFPGAGGLYRAVGLLGDEVGAGLEIRDVRTARQRDGADEMLTIEGTVANVTDQPLDLPSIRVSLSDADGEEIHFVTVPPEMPNVPPGETTSFEAVIVNPSAVVRRVKVKFVATSDTAQ